MTVNGKQVDKLQRLGSATNRFLHGFNIRVGDQWHTIRGAYSSDDMGNVTFHEVYEDCGGLLGEPKHMQLVDGCWEPR